MSYIAIALGILNTATLIVLVGVRKEQHDIIHTQNDTQATQNRTIRLQSDRLDALSERLNRWGSGARGGA